MSDINEKILKAMQEEQANDYVPEDQANIFSLIRQSFKGVFRFMAIAATLLMLLFAGLSVYCGYHMLDVADAGGKIEWATGALAAFMVFVALRLWFFMEINRLSVLREIKRVELQVALLADRS